MQAGAPKGVEVLWCGVKPFNSSTRSIVRALERCLYTDHQWNHGARSKVNLPKGFALDAHA